MVVSPGPCQTVSPRRTAGPARLVSVNRCIGREELNGRMASREYQPGRVLVVNAGADTSPSASLVAYTLGAPPANRPPQRSHAANWTTAPGTGSPWESVTRRVTRSV